MNYLGNQIKEFKLIKCSTADVHANYHEPEMATIIATKMKREMVEIVKLEPVGAVGRKREGSQIRKGAFKSSSLHLKGLPITN